MIRSLRTTLLLLLLGLGSSAGAQIIFLEDFDGMAGPTAGGAGTYVFPAGWILANVDNATPAGAVAYVNEAWERREDFSFSVVDSAAFSTSWYNPAGPADDWMWTPAIDVTTNSVLSWNAVTYDVDFPDGYEVRVMVSPNVPSGGTGVLGNMVSQSTVVFSTAAEATAWTTHSVPLDAYAGQTVYIGFRNNSNDKFLLLVDDVKVETELNIDAEMFFADTTTEYTLTPMPQAAPLNFNGSIRNNGLNDLTDVHAEVTVLRDGVQVYQDMSAMTAILAPGATATWTAPSYTPDAVGEHVVRFVAMQGSGADQDPLNDTLYHSFMVTDSVYARDDGTAVGSLGIGAGQVGFIGQSFDVVQQDVLSSVSVFLNRGYTGRQAAAVVWSMVSGVPEQIIAGTDTIIYPDDSARFYTIRMHGGGMLLTPGEYAVTMIEFDSTLAVANSNALFTTNTTWVNWPNNPFGAWSNAEDFGAGFAKSFILRANFGDVCANMQAVGNPTNATCATCSDGAMSVTVTGDNGGLTYDWNTGETTASISGLLPGEYIVTVTDQFGCQVIATANVEFSTGIVEAIGAAYLQLLPNPSPGPFAVRLAFEQPMEVDVDLYNATGQRVETRHVAGHASGDILFDGAHAPGAYSVVIRTERGTVTRALSIAH